MMQKIQESPFFSVIIPAYKEGERIGRTLLEIKEYFAAHPEWTYEIIVVVDGSPDDTAAVARNYMQQIPALRVIDNPDNHGKGYVVRQGLCNAQGKWRLFMDADGSTSITHLDAFMEVANNNDVLIGSRDIEGAYIKVHQPRYRELMGDMGNWLIRIVLGLWRYPDTQCGFKMLSARAAEDIAPRMMVDRFGFDFEMIAIARRHGYRVVQLPVRWMNEEGSTVSLFGPNGFVQVIIDLFKVRWRLWRGVYDRARDCGTLKTESSTVNKNTAL